MATIDFQKEVLDRSQEVPVVVDFWAPWCGPCRFLGPVIEELASEADGKWELVKVNTEENREISAQYQIMSIPAVKMFYRGEVAGEFVGALPRNQILKWLDTYLPTTEKSELDEIKSMMAGPDPETARQKLKDYVDNNPEVEEARLLHAWFQLWDDPEGARETVASIKDGNGLFEQAEDIRTLSGLMLFSKDEDSAVTEKLAASSRALRQNDPETAIRELIGAVMIDKNYSGDLPRKAAIALFRLWGPDHPLTKQYRKRFDMALY